MTENTKIEWATHTLNWWTGCEAISPACQSCYAASWAKRAGRDFSERRLTTEVTRRQPLKWQRNAAAFLAEHGHRQRVFVNSLSDWADNQVPQEWRASLFAMIRETADLDYLLLTKRIGNAVKMLPADWGSGYPNVWLGSTIANQTEADRDIPKLLATPARVRFLSCEPLLSLVDLPLEWLAPFKDTDASLNRTPRIDWVIAGGESGGKARPSHPDWFRSLRDQCVATEVPFLFKQWGEWHPEPSANYATGPSQYRYGRVDGVSMLNDGRLCLSNDASNPAARATVLDQSALDEWHRTCGRLEASRTDLKQALTDPLAYQWLHKIGKKAAGRTLDGVIHDAFPEVNR